MTSPRESLLSDRQRRKIKRDVAWRTFLSGDTRLALALLLWPAGWSHTRLDESLDRPESTFRKRESGA